MFKKKTNLSEQLSREPQLFVLERQKMQLLTDEQLFSPEESVFWNGAWLLEGMVDQNGSSGDTIIIDARLIPATSGSGTRCPLLPGISLGRSSCPERGKLKLKTEADDSL
jgi:TolB-like protein